MKNLSIIVILLIIIGYVHSDSWHIEVVDSDGKVGIGTSIALDSKDYPHISYSGENTYQCYCIKHAYWNGSSWNKDVVENTDNAYQAIDTSICINSNDYPYIAYHDYEYCVLKLAHWDGYKWNIEQVGGGNLGGYPTVILDKDNYPHISYTTYSGSGYLKYAYWTGSSWHIEFVDMDTHSADSGASMVFDSKGYPHISYIDDAISYLKYAYWDGSSWHIEIVDNPYSAFKGCSIALDSNDYPYILYDSQKGLKCAHFNGSNWDKSVVDASGYLNDQSRHIVIDNSGKLHISYKSGSSLKYGYFDGNKWNLTIVDSNGDVGNSSSIVLDSKGSPHISYYDYTNGDLKYAWYGPNIGITLTSFTAKPNNNAITLNWSVTTDVAISGFNLYRRVVTPTTVRELAPKGMPGGNAQSPLQSGEDYVWTKINTSLITGNNPYSYTDRTTDKSANYVYKLEAITYDKVEVLGETKTEGNQSPSSFALTSVYPNPANTNVNMTIAVPISTNIDISIYDISGRKVSIVASGLYSPGEYTLTSDVSGLTNGVYIVKMTTDGFSASKNFVVAK